MKKKALIITTLLLVALLSTCFAACGGDIDDIGGITSITVKFDTQGGSDVADIALSAGADLTLPTPPTKEGYVFGGWYKDASCENEWSLDDIKSLSANITVYAKWTPVSAENATLSSIAIDNASTHAVEFANGAAFSAEGLVIKATYSDATTKLLTASEYTVDSSAYVAATAGTYAIKVTAVADTTKTVSYNVTVSAPYITGISIKQNSTHKVAYEIGDTFSSEGLIVVATYNDKTVATLSANEFVLDSSKYNGETEGRYVIAIKLTANEKITTSYSVRVSAPVVSNISIGANSTQATTFPLYSEFSAEGLIVVANHESGSSRILSSEEYEIFVNYDSTYTNSFEVRISYKHFSVSYNCKVVEKEIKSIAVSNKSTHATEFPLGRGYSSEGLIIEATYTDDTKAPLASSAYNIDSTAFLNEKGEYSILISLGSDSSKTVSYKVTVTDPAITGLTITTEPKKEFIKGDEFSVGSLALKASYTDGTEKALTENDYTIDSTSFDGAVYGKYEISILVNGEKLYTYSVLVSGGVATSIRVSSTSTQQTEFLKGEAFNNSGLVVEEVYQDGSARILTKDEFTVVSSAYNAMVISDSYTITVNLTKLELSCTYSVKVVDNGLAGEYYLKTTDINMPSSFVDDWRKIDADCKIFGLNDEGAWKEPIGFTLVRKEGYLYLVVGEQPIAKIFLETKFFYLIDSETEEEIEYTYFDSAKETKITAIINNLGSQTILIAKGATIPTDVFNFIDNMNYVLYKDNAGQTAVLATDVFSDATSIYILPKKQNYEGKPFVGSYVEKGQKLVSWEYTFDGLAKSREYEFPYTATLLENGNYEISMSGQIYIFDVTSNVLIESFEGEITEHNKIDPAVSIIISLYNVEEGARKLIVKYVIPKNTSFNGIVYRNKYILADYDGSALTKDTDFTVTDVITSDLYIYENEKFGSILKGLFTFDGKGVVSYRKGMDIIAGSYEIVDLTKTQLTLKMSLGDTVLDSIFTNNEVSVTTEGIYKGKYVSGQLFAGMPFVGIWVNSEEPGTSFEIYQSGTGYYYNSSSGNVGGQMELISIEGKVYSFDYTTNTNGTDQTERIIVDMDAKTFTFRDKVLKGDKYLGEAFIGRFEYRGSVLSVETNGYINGLNITKVVNGDGIITLTVLEGETNVDYVYNIANDTITKGEEVYTRAVELDRSGFSYPQNNSFNGDNSTVWNIDNYGNVTIDYNYVGKVSNLTDAGFTFTKDDGAVVAITFAVVNNSLTFIYNEVTYSQALPLVFSYPFAGNNYRTKVGAEDTYYIMIMKNEDRLEISDSEGYKSGTIKTIAEDPENSNNIIVTTEFVTYPSDGSPEITEQKALVYQKDSDTFLYSGQSYTKVQN